MTATPTAHASPAQQRTPGAGAGLRLALPAALGTIPLGLAFGVLITQAGLAWWWGPVFAGVIFAGSFEFLLLGLILVAAPLGQIAATALLVNIRHVFYALSFPLHQLPGLTKAYGTFALTDEAWALTASRGARTWRAARILTMQLTLHLAWIGSVTIGAVGGTFVPDTVKGLQFALTALFVVLGIDAFRARRDVPAAVVAVGCAFLAQLLVGSDGMLVGGVALFLALATVRALIQRRRHNSHDRARADHDD